MIPLLSVSMSLSNNKFTHMAKEDLVHIFRDTEMTVIHLKKILAENEIDSLVKNDFESGVSSGFVAGTPKSVDLYVFAHDQSKAEPLVEQFIKALKK